MKKVLLRILCAVVIAALLVSATPFVIDAAMPSYNEALGNQSDDQKIQGLHLLKESAALSDNVIIYGSSELRTDYISTHPANFFKDKRSGFQVNLVGRGSCQSIIHAISIAASGDALANSPVVLVTSPQSYVEGGITPDMFFANFSKQQYITIMYDNTVSESIKTRLSKRVVEMFERYDSEFGTLQGYEDIRILAKIGAGEGFVSKASKTLTAPLFLFEKLISDQKDKVKSAQLINNCNDTTKNNPTEIDWEKEVLGAVEVAKGETTNNDFGMRNSDYKKNVGNNLARFKDKDKNLSYENSVEYDDLRLLLDICKEKGIEPMFVSVPLHAQWSDYTGFNKESRQKYYYKVKSVVSEYDVKFVDLSGYEYEEYFLCDTMHLGWKGWLKVNEEIDKFYHEFNN
ncbi:MAG: D-alanyl-lipoteichoic acid biosynthesis protein DltD [Oscillospiraceae bacterium]|nr:D-alanyl-lipoteichoic acid biosynthesis protein DltD [Oscillospiraceae bacterium]